MGEIGVLVGDSSARTDKFHQCGNTIKPGTQMPNGEQPVLFQVIMGLRN